MLKMRHKDLCMPHFKELLQGIKYDKPKEWYLKQIEHAPEKKIYMELLRALENMLNEVDFNDFKTAVTYFVNFLDNTMKDDRFVELYSKTRINPLLWRYKLNSMSVLEGAQPKQPQAETFYLKIVEKTKLNYKVIGTDGKLKDGVLFLEKLPKIKGMFPVTVSNILCSRPPYYLDSILKFALQEDHIPPSSNYPLEKTQSEYEKSYTHPTLRRICRRP